MSVSVTDPVGQAFNRMRHILFHDFDMTKWIVLGFCAFLANLGEGRSKIGFNRSFPSPSGGGRGGFSGNEMTQVTQWISTHLALILLIGGALLLFSFLLAMLFLWLGSRGKFMFLDGVVRNQAAVVEPWHRLKPLGNSLFLFRLVLMVIGFILFLGLAACAGLLAWPDIQAQRFGSNAIAAIVVLVLGWLPLVFVFLIIILLLNDFIVPIMYSRGLRTLEAFGVFRREVLPGYLGEFVLFYLLKLALGILAWLIMLAGCCVTCCIAALPYISSVVFLPIHVFFRCFSLYFLEQFGEEWRFFAEEEPELETPV